MTAPALADEARRYPERAVDEVLHGWVDGRAGTR